MTRIRTIGLILVTAIVAAIQLSASGEVGLYGIVERVVFEPSRTAPERIQVWGAFAHIEDSRTGWQVSPAERGYLYFKLPTAAPADIAAQADLAAARREWADLQDVAGTGQAIAFGRWGRYPTGAIPALTAPTPGYSLADQPARAAATELRVRPASEVPQSPATYQVNVGIVKLNEQGSHALIVARLKERLRR